MTNRLISQDIRTVDTASDWLIANLGTAILLVNDLRFRPSFHRNHRVLKHQNLTKIVKNKFNYILI